MLRTATIGEIGNDLLPPKQYGSAQSELLAHGCILRQGHDQPPHEVGDFRGLLLVGATVGVTAQQQSRVAWVSY